MQSKIINESISNINDKTLSYYTSLEQKIKKSICIIENNKTKFTGIFCKLPFVFIDKTYYVLIIQNLYLCKEDLCLGNELKIIIDNELNFVLLKIDNSRIIYREIKNLVLL